MRCLYVSRIDHAGQARCPQRPAHVCRAAKHGRTMGIQANGLAFNHESRGQRPGADLRDNAELGLVASRTALLQRDLQQGRGRKRGNNHHQHDG
jgi:hypothetical protein